MRLPDLCTYCKARSKCKSPCPPADTLADGNKPLREALINLDLSRAPNRDYKQTLIDHQEARKLLIRHTISDIRALPDYTHRLIAAALYADIPVTHIALTLNVTRQHIYRLIRLGYTQNRPNIP